MRLLVLYASQTGTAQDIAEQLWRKSKQWNFDGPVMAMDDYPIEKLISEHLVVFIISTTGDGEVPDNMHNFWKFLLRRQLPRDSLKQMKYACLGIGDSSYTKFNYAAKKVHNRLQQLGAEYLLPLALGDDQHEQGLGYVVLPWINDLFKILRLDKSFPKELKECEREIYKWICSTNRYSSDDNQINDDYLLWPHRIRSHRFKLLENLRTTDFHHFQDVRHLQFEIPDNIVWFPGDILQVHPHNSQQQIEEFFALIKECNMDFDANTIVSLKSNYEDMPLPQCYKKPLSVQQMVTYIWDLNGLPRQSTFELLALHCEDELEKNKLQDLSSVYGLDEMINYINRPRRNILEVLQDFRHACSKLTLNLFIEIFNIIQLRSFSIASCFESGKLDLLVAVVQYKTKMVKQRLGLCSNWLKCLQPGEEIWASINGGSMQIPKDITLPLIMVGPGTGIAPFRSIIQKRLYTTNTIEHSKDTIVIFFGCRGRLKDFHFKDDFEAWNQTGLIKFYVCFSQDQDHKIYVQHIIKEKIDELKDLILNHNALILVAGSSKNMPSDVKNAFINVLDNDVTYVERMLKDRRYQEETWS